MNDNKSVNEALAQAVGKLSDILATAAGADGQKKYLDYDGLGRFLGDITGVPVVEPESTDTVLVVRDGKLRRVSIADILAAAGEDFKVLPEDETVIDLDYEGTAVTREVESNTSWEVTQEQQ